MTTPTPLPMDAAARNLLHYINVMPDADTLLTPEVLFAETQLRAALSQPDTLAARVAELESKLAATQVTAHVHGERWEAAQKRVAELEADVVRLSCCVAEERMNALRHATHANALRSALEAMPCACDTHMALAGQECPRCAALAAHPAASLAAHDADVLERAAKVCDERAAEWRKLEDQYRERGQREFMEVACVQRQAAESLAAAIRALAAQAQEVKP